MCIKGNSAPNFCFRPWWFLKNPKYVGSHSEIFQVLTSQSIISTTNGQNHGMDGEGGGGGLKGEHPLWWDVGSEVSPLACNVMGGVQERNWSSFWNHKTIWEPPKAFCTQGADSLMGVSGQAFYNWVTWVVFLELPFTNLRQVTRRGYTPSWHGSNEHKRFQFHSSQWGLIMFKFSWNRYFMF